MLDHMVLRSQCAGVEKTDSGGTGSTAGSFIFKFQIGMKFIKFIKKLSELLFSMSPYQKHAGNITERLYYGCNS